MEASDDNRWADAQSDQGRGMKLASGASTLEVMEGARRYNRWIYDRVRDSLGQRVLEASGFVVERIRGRNPVGALGWLVNIRLFRQRRLRGAVLFDRLVPVLMVLDRVEMPLGLSLIAVA